MRLAGAIAVVIPTRPFSADELAGLHVSAAGDLEYVRRSRAPGLR